MTATETYAFPRVDPTGSATARKYYWATSGEPHMIRRREILAKYGDQVRKLYGYDHATAWVAGGVVLCQFIFAYMARSWSWGWVALAGWLLSGTLNQNLFTAQHEISHFLAFRTPWLNRAMALFANLPLVIPVAIKFREYHHDHHLFLGVDGGDVDLPTLWESRFVRNKFTKAIFGTVYLCIYGARPLLVRPKPFSTQDAVNWAIVLPCDLAILYFWGWKSLVYLFMGSILGGGPHPMAGHLLAEHYMFEPGQETYSYYGPLNLLSYNVGYHNEHHDFPQIPHTRLHKLRQIAPEFYKPLRAHTSWCWVIWRFMTDPDIGPWSRIHRLKREGSGPAANADFIASGCKIAPPLSTSAAANAAGGADATATVTLGGGAGGGAKGGLKARRNAAAGSAENQPPLQ